MWRRVAKIVLVALAALALPVGVASFGISQAADGVYPHRDRRLDATVPERTAPALDPARPTVAIVLGSQGANVADTLAPYEVFATTGRFNVVTVAPTAAPVTLAGGLDLVPDLTFAGLDARLPKPPEAIVVPQIHGSTSAVIEWLRAQRRENASLLISVCAGAQVLADAGLLDARPATSHWLKLIGLRRSHPEVRWTSGVRFVDDGDIITTAGVLSGIDGALRAVERLVDAGTAARVSRELHWNGYRPGGSLSIRAERPRPADLVALLGAAYRRHRPLTGVYLADGVGEIELAAALRPYTELSYLARTEPFSVDGSTVRSRHGLTFLPRSDWDTVAPHLDRVLVPGTTPTRLGRTTVPAVTLHRPGEFPFDGALRDIAGNYDVATARWVAKSLQYPARQGDLRGAAWPWGLTAAPLLLAAAGTGAALLAGRMLGRRRRSRSGSS